MSGSVPFVRAAVLTHRLLLRQLVTRGRIIALLALGGVLILAALGVAASAEIDDQVEAMVGVIDGLGLVLVVPVVALVFASASLGDGREDGTLVYLWLRPMDRLPVVIGAFFASITVSLPSRSFRWRSPPPSAAREAMASSPRSWRVVSVCSVTRPSSSCSACW